MAKSKLSTSLLFHLSLIITLFLFITGFYLIRFPTAEVLLVPYKDKPTKVIDIPKTEQVNKPPKEDIDHPLNDDGEPLEIEDVSEAKPEEKKEIKIPDVLAEKPDDPGDEIFFDPRALTSMPKLIHKEKVVYPAYAVSNRIEGKVFIEFIIDKQGIPTKIKVLGSPHILLEEAAVEAISKYRYKPGMQRGYPVYVRMSMPIKFELK